MNWELVTDPAGFSGDGAMQALPDETSTPGTPNAVLNTAVAVRNSPRMDFKVRFARTGTHHVWVRGYGPSGAADSLHVGLDGQFIISSDRITGFPASGWTWSKNTIDGAPATFNVPSVGTHLVTVWMRENGVAIDKILITANSSYVPTDLGPAESPPAVPHNYWRFEEASGDALDSEDARPGTVLGAAKRSTTVFGATVPGAGASNLQSMEFSGANGDAVDMGSAGLDISSGNFTLEGWINARAATGNGVPLFIAGKRISGFFGDKGYELLGRQSGDGLAVEMTVRAASGPVTVVSDVLAVGQWYHLAAVRNGTTLSFYVDGQLVKSVTDAAVAQNVTSAQHFSVGGAIQGAGTFQVPFDGFIDEVRLTKAALSPNQFLKPAEAGVELSFSVAANQPTVSWSAAGFVLQQNNDVADPAGWTDVPNGGTSPVTVTMDAAQKFYRLIQR